MNLKKIFLNEKLMRNTAIISVICSLIAFIVLYASKELTLLIGFEVAVKVLLTCLLLWSFSKFRWDDTKGMMGSLLFALLYQESFLVLGTLWGETADFDSILIMGVQGSLYLAGQSMSFMMTVIIIVNHFIIGYSNVGNWGNVVLNQLAIAFKIILYVLLLVVNMFLGVPLQQQIAAGFGYIADLNVIILLICVESQIDNFNELRHELLMQKRHKEGKHE